VPIVNRYAVNGIELDVIEAGDCANPAVVLCHGFPECAHSWRHQIGPLVDAGYHVLAPDQRDEAPSSVTTGARWSCGTSPACTLSGFAP
jgi:epoxide hydrolase 4